MPAINNVGVAATPLNIQGMDIETILLAVQSNRANLLETQLKDQLGSVQGKNDQIARLNNVLGQLNKLAALIPADAKSTDRLDFEIKVKEFSGNDFEWEKHLNSEMDAAGVRPFAKVDSDQWGRTLAWDKDKEFTRQDAADGSKKAGEYVGGVSGWTSKGQLEGAIQQLKGQIDSASNSQQMDMLRLQSLSNKRNEAFELMTNFIKKMQDNRSSIIGNMR